MFGTNNYLGAALSNEEIFRNILHDLKNNRESRPMGCHIPEDLDTDSPIDQLFEKYSQGHRYGIFTITNFTVSGNKAIIGFKNVATLSGGGAILEYSVVDEVNVEYSRSLFSMMS